MPIVVAGLSMGGSLALWTALHHPEVRGAGVRQPGARGRRRPTCGPCSPTSCAGRHRRDARHRQRHRRPRRPRVGLRGDAAATAAVVPRRRAGADRRPLRRADDAAAAVHVARRTTSSSRPTASTSPSTTAARSTTAGSSAATTWRRRTSTATSHRRRGGRLRRRRSPGRDRDGAAPASIPSPSSGHAGDRPAVAQRLRADDRPRRHRRRLAVRPAARGEGHRHPRGRQRASPCGASSPA